MAGFCFHQFSCASAMSICRVRDVGALAGLGGNEDHLGGTVPDRPRLPERLQVPDQDRRVRQRHEMRTRAAREPDRLGKRKGQVGVVRVGMGWIASRWGPADSDALTGIAGRPKEGEYTRQIGSPRKIPLRRNSSRKKLVKQEEAMIRLPALTS